MDKVQIQKFWDRIKPQLLVHIKVHYEDIIQDTADYRCSLIYSDTIRDFVQSRFPDLEYSDIDTFLAANNKEIDDMVKNASSNKILIPKNGVIALTNYGLNLVRKLYPFIRRMIRQAINEEKLFPEINTKIYDDWDISVELYKFLQVNSDNIQMYLNETLSDGEASHIYRFFIKKYLDTFVKYVQEYADKHFRMKEGPYESKKDQLKHIFKKVRIKLSEYLNDTNLRKIFTTFQLTHKYDPEIYDVSWFDNEGLLNEGYEQQFIYDYLIKHKDELLKQFGFNYPISDKLYADIIDSFLEEYRKDIAYKIYRLIMLKNRKVRLKRSRDLLNLQDDNKIGVKNSITIDFDITNDYIRDRPIIIVEDVNTCQPHVLFGKEGQSHGMCINMDLNKMCEKENITMNSNKLGYGYLLGSIAFVDEVADGHQIGYTNDEVVNILKRDPRIKKIYTTPPQRGKGGPITRLARKR